MGRIVAQVTIENAITPENRGETHALVDTGAAYLTLPSAWLGKFGDFHRTETIELELADQSIMHGEICGPVSIQIEGCRAIYSEVLFIEMKSTDGHYEPLIGYLPLEQSQVAVDMLGHRLVPVKHADLK